MIFIQLDHALISVKGVFREVYSYGNISFIILTTIIIKVSGMQVLNSAHEENGFEYLNANYHLKLIMTVYLKRRSKE